MRRVEDLSGDEINRVLAYAGLVLVAYELVRNLIIRPIEFFYEDTTFHDDPVFKSYQEDVLSRHKNEFDAHLLYLRDFMKAIDSEDVVAIRALGKHRDDLVDELADRLPSIDINEFVPLLNNVDKALFKLSKHNTYMEIGADPEFQKLGIDWDTVIGHEYFLFREVVKKTKLLEINPYVG